MPIELAHEPNRFEEIMEELAMILYTQSKIIEAQFAEIASQPDHIEQIILEDWMNNLVVRASRIRQANDFTGIPF